MSAPNNNVAPDDTELLRTAQSDLASLRRVFHRLTSLSDATQFGNVLSKLLPRLVQRLGDNHAKRNAATAPPAAVDAVYGQIHAQLTDMMSHILQRVRLDTQCPIPAVALLQLLVDDATWTRRQSVDPFTKNLALTFLAIPRAHRTAAEWAALLPYLLVLRSECWTAPSSQVRSVAHLLLKCLVGLTNSKTEKALPPSPSTKPNDTAKTNDELETHLETARKLCHEDESIGAAVYSLLLDVLLYTNQTTTSNASSSSLPPPGLSATAAHVLRTGPSTLAKDWAGEMALAGQLTRTKLALLTLVAPARRFLLLLEDTARTLTLLVLASGDAHGDVADQAKLFVKMFLDAYHRNDKSTIQDPESNKSMTSSWSQWVALQVLPLALGQAQADGFAAVSLEYPDTVMETMTQQERLGWQRRPLDSLVTASALSFVTKQWQDVVTHDTKIEQLRVLCSWMQGLTRNYLMDPSHHLTLQKARIATAQAMEALTIRCTTDSSLTNDPHILSALTGLKDAACHVLTKVGYGTSVSGSGTSSSHALDGSLSIREACYGVLSHLARSPVVCHIVMTNASGDSSIDIVKLLFTCASKEDERLQPKAVAALDALLSSYTRLYSEGGQSSVTPSVNVPSAGVPSTADASNPWAAISQATDESRKDGTSNPDRVSLARSLLPLLWTASQAHQAKASRVAAARWSQGILRHLDLVKACHLLCFLAGDVDVTAASLARQGLGLESTDIMGSLESFDGVGLPDFADFVRLVFATTASSGAETRVQHYPDFSWAGKATTLRFGMECLLSDLYGGDDEAVALYLQNLDDTLAFFHTNSARNMTNSPQGSALMDLLDVSSGCFATTLASSRHARTLLAENKTGFQLREVEQLVFSASSSRARRFLAEAIGEMYRDGAIWGACHTLQLWLDSTKIVESLEKCCKEIVQLEKSHVVLGPLHGSLYLGAQLVRAIRLKIVAFDASFDNTETWEKMCTILSMLAKGIESKDDVIGNASADSLALALSYPGKDAPALNTRLSNVLYTILEGLAAAIKAYKDGDATDAPRINKLVEAAGVCLAATTSYDSREGNRFGISRMTCFEGLISLLGSGANRKEEEIALRVGEALGRYAGCYNVDAELHAWGEGFDDQLSQSLKPHEHALFVLLRKQYRLSNPLNRTACAPALLGIVAAVARDVNTDTSYAERPLTKAIIRNLGEIQSVFLGLLSDPKSKHMSRESCCLGIAACHGIVKAVPSSSICEASTETTQSLSIRLMYSFGQTTNHGGSAYQETRAQAEQRRAAARNESNNATTTPDIMEAFGVGSEAGGAANMGEAALGAYREMAAASVSLERPDVLYDLLLLSVSHPVWFSDDTRHRYGATALIGGDLNHMKMREALKPHLGKLLPKILRACNDPNKQTREQMSSLLAGLTGGGPETRQAISVHLLDVVDVLLQDSASKFWRARVGACGALADVIVGRDWMELGGGGPMLEDEFLYDTGTHVGTAVRILRLWRAVLRALDDVRDAVRQSGKTLGRAVRSLTLRLCDPSAQEKSSGDKRARADLGNIERDASNAAATALRWLVKHGLTQTVPESQGICVATLVDIVGVAKPAILEPSLPELIRSLLLAMSGLEPAALNYLQLRTRDQDGLERARLQLAQSGPLATAVNKCVELLPMAKVQTQQDVVVALDRALRLSSGFASRAAVADTAALMCNTCPGAFTFPGLSGTSNPSVRLMRAFYFATEKERGQGAKDKMTHALGNIAEFCPGSSVRSLALQACARYRASTGSNNDPASRRAAAGALRAIVVRATKQLSDGGNSDIWSQVVLPIAFLGQKDGEAKVAALMKEVWEEGGPSVQDSVSQEFGTRIEEALLPELVKECVRALQDLSFERRVAGAKSLAELCILGVLSPLRISGTRETDGMARTGSMLKRAKRRAQNCNIAMSASIRLLKKPRLWNGKSKVVEETVKLVSSWLPLANSDGAEGLLGVEGKGECTWLPLSFESAEGILLGDASYDASRMEEDVSLEEAQNSAEGGPADINDENNTLDFDSMDKELTAERTDEKATDNETEYATLSLPGFCRFLVEEALPDTPSAVLALSEEFLPYRTAGLRGFRDLIKKLPGDSGDSIRRLIFENVETKLLSVLSKESGVEAEAKKTPPVLVAASIECIGACLWKPFPRERAEKLVTLLQTSGGPRQSAWTIRESSAIALSQMAACCDEAFLRRPSTIAGMLSAASWALQDKKFWRVRVAGLQLVKSMIRRSGTESDRINLALEALLPHKESFQKLLRKALSDSEPNVTSLSSQIIIDMSWWP